MPSHPLATAHLPGTGGALKVAPEDFIVEEIPSYPPSGTGTHLFLLVEKRAITTHEMVRRIARALNIPSTSIGTAGQKDRHAIARQLVSVPAEDVEKASNLRLDDVTVLSAARHENKLRTGHLRGNRFTIVVRGVVEDAEARARAVLDHVAQNLLPNFFGPQRFGRGDNADKGRALLEGRLRISDRFEKRFLLSSLQSHLFNRFLSERINEGLLHRAIEGDVMQKIGSGGLFVVAPHELLAAQARMEAREIVATGPIYGERMFQPGPASTAETRERAVLEAEHIDVARFGAFGKLAQGTRRPLCVRVERPEARMDGDHLVLSFALPSGSYATVLLQEIMKSAAPTPDPAAAPEALESDGDDPDPAS